MIDRVLGAVFGLDGFRPGQREAVEAAMSGRDALVVLPTGGGKSLCYQVPAVALARQGRGKTVVVSPLIALMDDQVAALRARGVQAVALHSGLEDPAAARAALKTAEIVYVSPERLAKPAARRALGAGGVALVAVDEAHCISQWGHDFRKDYQGLSAVREWGAPVLALTATATARVRDEICQSLALRDPVRVLGAVGRPLLAVSVEHHKGDKDRLARAIACIRERGLDRGDAGRVIVYAATRKRVVDVAAGLNAAGIKAVHYHAGRTTGARAKAQTAFAEGGRAVMVATCAFGMGIDLPDVRLVLHVQSSGSLEAWWQEAGRAGRDGLPAAAVLLYADMDGVTQARLRGKSPPPGAEAGWRALVDFAYGTTCRQAVVSRHFVGEAGPACGVCDVCVGADVGASVADARARGADRRRARAEKEEADAAFPITEAHTAAILAFVGRMKRPCGRKLVAQALRGSVAAGVKRRGLASLEGHGALKGVPELAIDGAIGDLLAEGRLVKKGKKYPTVWLAERPVRPSAADRAASDRPARAPRYQGLAKVIADWRRAEARRRRVKPYQVLDNATLAVIVASRPSTVDALAALPGIGPARLSRYADTLLELVKRA